MDAEPKTNHQLEAELNQLRQEFETYKTQSQAENLKLQEKVKTLQEQVSEQGLNRL